MIAVRFIGIFKDGKEYPLHKEAKLYASETEAEQEALIAFNHYSISSIRCEYYILSNNHVLHRPKEKE